MLILPAEEQQRQREDARRGITDHFNTQMENILNANKDKDVYWILGKAANHRHGDKQIVRTFLQACAEKPGLIKESFVYQVDNKRGVKTLLWVMHPDETLSFPTLGKSIRVTGGKSGSKILLPS